MNVDAKTLSELAYNMLISIVIPLVFVLFVIGLIIKKRKGETDIGELVLLLFYCAITASAFGTLVTVLLSFLNRIFPNESLSILVLPSIAGTATFSIISSYAYLDFLFHLRRKKKPP